MHKVVVKETGVLLLQPGQAVRKAISIQPEKILIESRHFQFHFDGRYVRRLTPVAGHQGYH